MSKNDTLDRADKYFEQGIYDKALVNLRSYCQSAPDDIEQWFRLAISEEQLGTKEGTESAYQHCLNLNVNYVRLYLFAGMFFLNTQRQQKGLALLSLGFDIDPSMIYWFQNETLDDQVRGRSYYAGLALRNHFTKLSSIKLSDKGNCQGAIWPQTHNEPWQYKNANQKPHLFYLPALKAQPFWSNSNFDWTDEFLSRFDELQGEFSEIIEDIEASGEPYVDKNFADKSFEKLAGSKNWTALHLFKNGVEDTSLTSRMPILNKLLMKIDLYGLDDKPYEVFFSLLKAGQHIVPHYGLSNHSLTVHVPFVVGDSGKLTVDHIAREWQKGESLVFDDSFEHEAINTSNQDRVVLIFSIWHPDLTQDERTAIQASFNARQEWLNSRSQLIKS